MEILATLGRTLGFSLAAGYVPITARSLSRTSAGISTAFNV